MPPKSKSSKFVLKKKPSYLSRKKYLIKDNMKVNQSGSQLINPTIKDKTITMRFNRVAKTVQQVSGVFPTSDLASGFNFKLSDIGTAGVSLASVYRFYRIVGINVKWMLNRQDNTATNVRLMHRYSYDQEQVAQSSAGQISVDEWRSLNNVVLHTFTENTPNSVYKIRPRLQCFSQATGSITDTAYTIKPKWLSTADNTINHLGYIYSFDNVSATSGNPLVVQCHIEYIIQFKGQNFVV